MAELKKVRVQLINETTGAVEDEVNVLTAPEAVLFSDGKTLSQKLEEIQLTPGPKGEKGDKGDKGEKGEPGDNIKVGADLATAEQKKLFFKVV